MLVNAFEIIVCEMAAILSTGRWVNLLSNWFVLIMYFFLFQTDVAQKLRDKENAFINRINKVHKVAEK